MLFRGTSKERLLNAALKVALKKSVIDCDNRIKIPPMIPPPKTEPAIRYQRLLIITRRLILMTLTALLIITSMFAVTLLFQKKFLVSWMCFGTGLVGGFVSIQQRIKNVSDEELELLSMSWYQILLIPVYGGIFALVLYLAFLSGVIEGGLFPKFSIPEFSNPTSTDDLKGFFAGTYPQSGTDFAKLVFWSFVAGFSERFVPQIVSGVERRGSNGSSDGKK